MLTRISSYAAISRFQGQSSLSSEVFKTAGNDAGALESDRDERSAQVELTQRAKDLQQTYQTKERGLETNYNNETKQLEREYQQNKAKLERELQQKKQALKVDIYA